MHHSTDSALDPSPLTQAEIFELLAELPKIDSHSWKACVEKIQIRRWHVIQEVLADLSEEQFKRLEERFTQLVLPSDWDRHMDVLSNAHEIRYKELMTIGIPGLVAQIKVNIQEVDVDEAIKRINMNTQLRMQRHNMSPEEAIFCFFEADIRARKHLHSYDKSLARTNDLINAYRVRLLSLTSDEAKRWGVKDSAINYISELRRIAENSTDDTHGDLLSTRSKAYAGFCKYNDWLTRQLTCRQEKTDQKRREKNRTRNSTFSPPNPAVYVCDETEDFERQFGYDYVS